MEETEQEVIRRLAEENRTLKAQEAVLQLKKTTLEQRMGVQPDGRR